MTEKKHNSSTDPVPYNKKAGLFLIGLVLFSGVVAAVFYQDFEDFFGENFQTSISMLMGLILIFVFNVWPYLNNKDNHQLKKNDFRARIPSSLYGLGAISLCFIIPLVFGKMVSDILIANDLPQRLPLYILLLLSLGLWLLSKKKLNLMGDNQQNNEQASSLEIKSSKTKIGFLPYGLSIFGFVLIQFLFRDIFRFFGESSSTVIALLLGFLMIYAGSVGPYLNKKYIPQFKTNPQKIIPYFIYNLVAFSFYFIIPLAFGDMVFHFLNSFNLPMFLPLYIALPMPLIINYFTEVKFFQL